MCIIRIFMSWIPGIQYNGIYRFLSSLTDPYMNLFRKLPFNFAGIDFSPILSLGILSILESVFREIASTGVIQIKGILTTLIFLLWNMILTFCGIFIIFLIIRLIVLIVNHNTTPYDSIWNRIDYTLRDKVFRMSRFFTRGKSCSYRTAILLVILEMILILAASYTILTLLSIAVGFIPF